MAGLAIGVESLEILSGVVPEKRQVYLARLVDLRKGSSPPPRRQTRTMRRRSSSRPRRN